MCQTQVNASQRTVPANFGSADYGDSGCSLYRIIMVYPFVKKSGNQMGKKIIVQACCVMLLLGLGGNMDTTQAGERKKQVVLLHGLARSQRSMAKMEQALKARG